MEEQPYRGADTEQHSERFNDWLERARWGADVRNRIAVSGNKIGRGRFGELHLLAQDESLSIAICDEQQSAELLKGTAANDEVFAQPVVSRNQRR